ncbi:FAD binding domain-containing protein [Actinocrispum sp. NPDC049592]|uniref:FAD binding domain-containing protein n=1 Tax=Actinocrispum sp. NPDC049592 TaxID=3154835 RepID=UPI00343D5FE5
MIPFTYERVGTVAEAVEHSTAPGSMLIAGGTEVVNWLRLGVHGPATLVDLKTVPGLADISLVGETVHIGPLVRLADVAAHPWVAQRFPVLRESIHLAASAQLRNLATIGGNPLQYTRCPYFRAEAETPCTKRRPGSGCAARHGITDNQAIFGWTDDCVAVQPSDPGTALAALDAVYVTRHADGGRRIAARELNTLPSQDAVAHNMLRPGEVITDIEITGTAPTSTYLKVRPRASYEFATVAVAVALEVDGDLVRRARIALGSVAMRPWRLDATERLLVGHRIGSAAAQRAIEAGFADAKPLPGNEYKITLARNAVARALRQAVTA